MGNRLLLADDSITIQKVVGIIFANEELFELTVVDNGTAALEKAREIHPDVMLVDALMPGKSGYEVCQEVRRDPALANTPLLLLIGAFDPVDEEKTRQCGADASITKPFESQQLIDRVKELLETGKERKAAPPKPAPAPAAAPAPAPEDIWGELAAESVAPVTAPAAPQAPARPAAPAAPPAAPKAAAAPAVPEIEEANIEDDLWGAFELLDEVVEEEEPAAPVAPAPQAATAPPTPAAPAVEAAPAEDFFAAPPAAPAAPAAQAEGEYEVEEFFTFEEDEEGVEETEPVDEVLAEGFAFEQPEPFTFEEEPAEPEITETFAQLAPEPFASAAEEAAPTPVAAPAAAPVAPPAPAGEIGEVALVAALRKVSREVIERIVWEVVPDLAEALIKEEIRKIKAGSGE